MNIFSWLVAVVAVVVCVAGLAAALHARSVRRLVK
jgi:hypothetical protein